MNQVRSTAPEGSAAPASGIDGSRWLGLVAVLFAVSAVVATSGPAIGAVGFAGLALVGAALIAMVIRSRSLSPIVRALVVFAVVGTLAGPIPSVIWNVADPERRLHWVFERTEAESQALVEAARQCSAEIGAAPATAAEGAAPGADGIRIAQVRNSLNGPQGSAWLLLDASGDVLEWTGPDLRHALPTERLRSASPAAQLMAVSSATAVTRIGLSGIAENGGRCLVARSDSTSRLPLSSFRRSAPQRRQRQWTIRAIDSQQADSLADSWFERRLEGDEEGAVVRIRRDAETRRAPSRATALLAGITLLVLFVGLQASQLAMWLTRPRGSWLSSTGLLLLLSTGFCAWWGSGGNDLLRLSLGLGVLLVPLATFWLRRDRPEFATAAFASVPARLVLGLLGGASVVLIVAVTDPGTGRGLGDQILSSLDLWMLRLLCVAALACWLAMGDRPSFVRRPLRTVLLWSAACSSALVSPLLFDAPAPRLAGALIGAAVAGVAGLRSGGSRTWEAPVLGVTLVAMSIGVATQQLRARSALRDAFDTDRSIVDAASAEQFLLEIDQQIGELPLETLVAGHPEELDDAADLALAFWEATSLVDSVGLSAIAVTDRNGELVSSFSFGLPLRRNEAALDPDSRRWQGGVFDAWWDHAVAHLETPLYVGGQPWGTLHLWAVPLLRTPPSSERPEMGILAEDLLLGSKLNAWRLPLDAALVVRSSGDGRRRLGAGPWQQITLPPPLGSTPTELEQSTNESLTIYRRGAEGLDAELSLSVPESGLGAELLRPLTAGASLLAVVGLLLLLFAATVLILERDVRLAVRRAVLTYSRKLVLVVIGVAVLPLALFNAFLFQSTQQRSLVDQRTAGETGLRAAERLVGEYLPNLRPGYSLSELFEDQLLDWLPEVVGNEINVYWRGRWQTSSRPELAVAGVVPQILPSEVSSDLARSPTSSSVRGRRSGVEHSEIYRRLLIGGGGADSGFVLSLPLLAQNREAAASFERLAQQSLVLTVLLLLVLSALGRRLAQNFSGPLEEVVEGTVAISEGAVELDLEPREPELATLVRAVDVMARRISSARGALESEKELLGAVLDHVPSAVFAADRAGEIVVVNPEARRLLGVRAGTTLAEAMARPPLAELGQGFPGDVPAQRSLSSPLQDDDSGTDRGPQRDLQIAWVPLTGGGESAERFRLHGVLIAEDVTEILRGQRARTWAQMARMIAHEIKNPLTPIRLSAEHLRNVKRRSPERLDEVFDACIDNILEQVAELRHTAAEFSAIDRLPSLDPTARSLRTTVDGVIDSYRHLPDVRVSCLEADELDRIEVAHDRRMIARVLRNLIENAVTALRRPAEGTDSVERRNGEIVLRHQLDPANGVVRLLVTDTGPGVPSSQVEQIFEPNFSSRSGGTGLGLAISRRIAEQHGGSLKARPGPEGRGLEVELTLPLDGADGDPRSADDGRQQG